MNFIAKQVVELFENYPLQSDDGYIFPVLHAQYDSARKIRTRIATALKEFNDDLEDFEKAIQSPKHITSYTLRHSFATHLRKKKVDISIIQAALGHDTEEQTQVYLEELEDALVTDEINAAL